LQGSDKSNGAFRLEKNLFVWKIAHAFLEKGLCLFSETHLRWQDSSRIVASSFTINNPKKVIQNEKIRIFALPTIPD